MFLRSHIADYQRALSTNTEYSTRSALQQLYYDPLVQVLSFVPDEAVARVLHTLGAVSPRVRLDAESLVWVPNSNDEYVRACVWFERLHCGIRATAAAPPTPRAALSLWWASRCELPLQVAVNNVRSDVLAFLAGECASRVETLEVHVTSEPVCVRRGAATACDGRCGCVLCSLPVFTRLQKLSIACGDALGGKRAAATLLRALRSVVRLPIAELVLCGSVQLSEMSSLSGADHLTSLTAKSCGLRSVAELLSCANLRKLDVSDNHELKNVAVLAEARCLEELDVEGCGLTDLEGLSRCPRLRKLDASSNRRLKSTRSLAGAPFLEELYISCCKTLANVDGLGSCPLLKILDVQFSFKLRDFRGAAGAPSLQSINAIGCGLASLAGLSSCPRLTDIVFCENDRFPDPRGLAGAPSLRFINASDTGLRNLSGLNRCPHLVEVLLNASDWLEDISGLAGAPCLEKVEAMNCQIRNVRGLGDCPMLAELDLGGNDPLEDVSDLARCPRLKLLDVSGTAVTDVSMFGPSVDVRL